MFRLISSVLPERAIQGLTGVYFKSQHLLTVGRGKCHSSQVTVDHLNMKVQVLPALSDNYMYLLIDEASREAAVVDPVNPESVLAAVEEAGVTLTTVLTTHHHWDHASGNEKLVSSYPLPLKVVGGDERIPALNQRVGEGDTFKVGSANVRCLFTPCHTTGHICYYITHGESNPHLVFTGDTLFLSGCGKFFEGTADQMTASLSALSALPDHTHVYCGHEYALSNLAFAAHVQSGNAALAAKTEDVAQRREEGRPSVPSTIGEEKSYNPFMRVWGEELQARYGTQDPVQAMAALRKEKDHWKPPARD